MRTRKIPTWLTYSGLFAAPGGSLHVKGMAGSEGRFCGGAGRGGGLFFVLFLLGGMGGGDVKLMAAVGAWARTAQAMPILIASAIAGGILAVGYTVLGRRGRLTIRNTMKVVRHHLTSGLQPHPALNVQQPTSMRIPYGLAIAMGTLYCVGNAFGWR